MSQITIKAYVSNSPCGVESPPKLPLQLIMPLRVSNSPCGVESKKDHKQESPIPKVSNSPCGVESGFPSHQLFEVSQFLIHRVELKVIGLLVCAYTSTRF